MIERNHLLTPRELPMRTTTTPPKNEPKIVVQKPSFGSEAIDFSVGSKKEMNPKRRKLMNNWKPEDVKTVKNVEYVGGRKTSPCKILHPSDWSFNR